MFSITTVHDTTYNLDDYTITNWRCLANANTAVRTVFGEYARMMLLIPRVIDNYNQCINDVDHADYLWSSMTTHLISHRVWLPLFYWLLDCAKVNAWCLYNIHYKEENDHINSAEEASKRFTHWEFQQELAYSLILDGYRKMKGHVSRNDPMPDKRVVQKKGININEFRLRESKTVLSHQ